MVHIQTTVKNKLLVKKRRMQITMAAIRLFAQNGFHKTTLKELAEEAGLSYGNIYDYVGSKEDIFFLIHGFLADSAMEILNRSIDEIQDPIEKLRRMVRGEFNLMDQWADALLLIYQESHILHGEFLKKLLQKERAHLEKFEIVLDECITQGKLHPCNVRLVSNLIKSMIDSWTIKRWDLRGHANQLEAERSIMDMLTRGLFTNGDLTDNKRLETNALSGKTALVFNGGTFLGQAVCHAASSKGIQVINFVDQRSVIWKPSKNIGMEAFYEPVHTISGPKGLSDSQIIDIEKQYGPIDFFIQDIGIGTTELPRETLLGNCQKPEVFLALETNLAMAKQLGHFFKKRMGDRAGGRIVFLSPWSWDEYADPTGFEVVKAGTIALTRSLAKQLASVNVNVNCIIPGYIRGVRPLKIEKILSHKLLSKIPSGRLGEIFDITEIVLFLIQDSTKYLTGQTLHVTGGENSLTT
jgi:3-oxoacyl-[acyl-carrier protein] reductase